MSRASIVLSVGALFAPLAGCQSSDAGSDLAPIHENLAVFQLNSERVKAGDGGDDLSKLLVARFKDPEASGRLLDAIRRNCRADSITPLAYTARSDDEVSLAWQDQANASVAITLEVRPRAGVASTRSGSWVLSTVGWLICGIPGYVVDDYEYALPFDLEAKVFRKDRTGRRVALGAVNVASGLSTDYIDRNSFFSFPYVLTILVPPHVLSVWEMDDLNATAEAIFGSALDEVGKGVAAKLRESEVTKKTAKTASPGG